MAWFAAVMVFTRAVSIGSDAYWYVQDIRGAMGRPMLEVRALWDFAHLLWRPWGVLLAKAWMAPLTPWFAGGEQSAVTFLLLLTNVIATLVSCFLVQNAVWKLTGKPWIATLMAATFVGFSPLLNDSRDGAPYVTAFTLSFAALYVAMFSRSGHPVWAGVLSALAAACWAPMLASFPAVLVARPILHHQNVRTGARSLAVMVAACGITGMILFGGAAVFAAGITSFAEFRAWMAQGAADVDGIRERTWLRMGTGMVRGIYHLGQDSVWFKWYLFRDPYARLGLAELFQVSLVRIALFYSLLLALVVMLWRSYLGRRLLLVLTTLTVPHLALALRFESGSPERYIGPLGLLAVACGYIVASERGWRRIVALLLCCAPVPFNVLASNAQAVDTAIAHDAGRIRPLIGIPDSSRMFVLGLSDSLLNLRYAASFHPLQKEVLPRIGTIRPFGQLAWRLAFACAIQTAWDGGGQVWITIRVLREEPLREWLWVEGDDPSITWRAVHALGSSLERGETRGGEDGFFVMKDSPMNRQILQEELGRENACTPKTQL